MFDLSCNNLVTFCHSRSSDSDGPQRLAFVMATTDGGPNEVYAKKIIQALLRGLSGVFFLPNNCLEHISHIGVLAALKLCDQWLKGHRQWKFFSSVAIIATTLRDLSQSLFRTWKSLYGDASAIEAVKALFPRCIAGRWGSIDHTEERLLHANIGKLAKAVKHMFEATPTLLENDKAASKAAEENTVDQIALEETKEFKLKMGRWRRQTHTVLQDSLFEKLVDVMHQTRRPWMHLSFFLKKKLPKDSRGGHLFLLVCGKALELLDEFSKMIFNSSLAPKLWNPLI